MVPLAIFLERGLGQNVMANRTYKGGVRCAGNQRLHGAELEGAKKAG